MFDLSPVTCKVCGSNLWILNNSQNQKDGFLMYMICGKCKSQEVGINKAVVTGFATGVLKKS